MAVLAVVGSSTLSKVPPCDPSFCKACFDYCGVPPYTCDDTNTACEVDPICLACEHSCPTHEDCPVGCLADNKECPETMDDTSTTTTSESSTITIETSTTPTEAMSTRTTALTTTTSTTTTTTSASLFQKSLVKGLMAFENVIESTVNGETYRVAFNVTTSEAGIVSLSAIKEAIKSITCSIDDSGGDPSVVVTLRPDLEVESTTEQLFPIDSLLVVDGKHFGSCELKDLPIDFSDSFDDFPEDGFLQIKSVTADANTVTIKGVSKSFFDMFESSDFRIERISDNR